MNSNAPLVLREIRYEAFGEDEEGQPIVEPKPAKPGLFSRAKAAMKDNVDRAKKAVRDPTVALTKVLPSLRTAKDRWQSLQEESKREGDVSEYTAHVEAARKRLAAEKSIENHEKLFLAEAVFKEADRMAQFALNAERRGDLHEKWKAEFLPKIRDTIRVALQLKYAAAKSGLLPERIKAEQKRLADKGDYDGVANVKKSATNAVEFWEGQLTRLDIRDTIYEVTLDVGRLLAAIDLLLEGFETTGDKYLHKASNDIFNLTVGEKMGADGPEKVFKLKTNQGHYHECNEKEFQENFRKL